MRLNFGGSIPHPFWHCSPFHGRHNHPQSSSPSSSSCPSSTSWSPPSASSPSSSKVTTFNTFACDSSAHRLLEMMHFHFETPYTLKNPNSQDLVKFNNISGWGRFLSFRLRFPGTECLAFRFVGAYGSVRFAEMIVSFRFVSFPFLSFRFVSFRFVSVRFVSFRTYLTYFRFRFVSVSQTACDFSEFAWGKILFWRRACGSGGLERIVDVRVCKSNVENAA